MRTVVRILGLVLLASVAGYIIWDRIEARALARDIAAIAARGEPITTAEPPHGADTPERLEAAQLYAAAASRVAALTPEDTLNLWRVDVDSPTSPPLAELEGRYRPDAPYLQLLDRAAPLDFNGFGELEVDSQEQFRLAIVFADLRADLLSARGKPNDAVASLVSAVRAHRTLSSSIDRPIVAARLLGSVRILLRHTSPDEASLARLQQAVTELPDEDSVLSQVQRRRAEMIGWWSNERDSLPQAVARRLLRPIVARAQRRQLAAMDEAVAAAREPWPAKMAAARRLEARYVSSTRELMKRRGFFADLMLAYSPAVAGSVNVTGAGQELAARRVVLAALAVERYRRAHDGTPPATLQELVPAYLRSVPTDPFSGAALIYRGTPSGFVIYSVDANGKDDGGAFYGIGTNNQLNPLRGVPRDFGIRVEKKVEGRR